MTVRADWLIISAFGSGIRIKMNDVAVYLTHDSMLSEAVPNIEGLCGSPNNDPEGSYSLCFKVWIYAFITYLSNEYITIDN